MKSIYQEARDCLEEVIPFLEAGFVIRTGHWCGGPDASCDMICVDNARLSEVISNVRRVQGMLDKIIKSQSRLSPDDLEVPHQKVDPYARVPSALSDAMPNY